MFNHTKYKKYVVFCLIALSLCVLWGCGQPKDTFKESRSHFQLGLDQYKKLNMAEAILEFEYAIHLDPGFAEPHYYLGSAYQKIGGLDEASRYYNLFLKFEPEHTDTHLQLARIYHRKGDDIKALEEGQYVLNRLPPGETAAADIHSILGEIYLKVKDDYEAAAYHYRQVMEYDPKKPAVYLAFAQIYLAQEDIENAISMLKQVIALDPKNKEAAGFLISLYHKQGKLNDLIALYKQMLVQILTEEKLPIKEKMTPEEMDLLKTKLPQKKVQALSDIHGELALAYLEQDKIDLAMEHAKQALEGNSGNFQARSALAKCYMVRKQYAEALQEYENLRNQDYNLEETLTNLALIYRLTERVMNAIEAYEQLIFIRPDNFEAQYYLTTLSIKIQQWDRAIRGGKELLKRFYNFLPAHLFLGQAYLFSGDWDEAINQLQIYTLPESERKSTQDLEFYEIAYPNLIPPKEFLEIFQEEREIEAHYLLGLAYLGKQRLEEASQEFDRVSEKLPNLGDTYLNKAIVYHLMNDFEQAVFNCQLASQQVGINKNLLNFILANIYTSKGDMAHAQQYLKQSEGLIYGFSLDKMDVTKNVSIKEPLSLAHLSLGVVYLLNGWKSAAKPEFDIVLRANPQNPLAKYLANEIYQLMNKYYYKSTHLATVLNRIYQK